MAKGPRTKVAGDLKTQSERDAEAKEGLRKGGGPMAKHSKHHTREAEKAEMASYRLNKRSKF